MYHGPPVFLITKIHFFDGRKWENVGRQLKIDAAFMRKMLLLHKEFAMKRYFIHLAYNGLRYHGYQIQPDASSVQEELEKCLSMKLGQTIGVIDCGRTDTDVSFVASLLYWFEDGAIDKHMKISS